MAEGKLKPPRVWTVAEICKLFDVKSKARIFNEIHAKRLRAHLDPKVKLPVKRWLIKHEDLCKWLLKSGFPLEDFRYKLNPGDALLAVGLSTRHMQAVNRFRLIPASSMFRLGQLTRENHCWAIIVGFPSVGADTAIAMAREYSKESGRPYLIAMIGEDRGHVRAADVFDILLPANCEPEVLSVAIGRLKKWGDRGE